MVFIRIPVLVLVCSRCFFFFLPSNHIARQNLRRTERKYRWTDSIKTCSFQKESVVCGRRIGIRKGSGDIVYYPRHEDPSYSLSCSGNRQEKNNNSEYWKPVEEHRVGLQTSASRSMRETLKEKESGILGPIPKGSYRCCCCHFSHSAYWFPTRRNYLTRSQSVVC